MRSPATPLVVVFCLVICPAYAEQSATRTVQARVQFGSRTSLSVSSDILTFSHSEPESPTVVTVDFIARARTESAGDVVLTVELLRAVEGPGGSADVDVDLSFTGEGAGTRAGLLSTEPAIAGRWTGGGSRSGRLSFALRSGIRGSYTVPVRFVLTAP